MKRCHACQNVLELKPPVGRRETCPFCGADLHCCLNCVRYCVGVYNDCREPQAERVPLKDRSNFCDFFAFRDADAIDGEKQRSESAKTQLESLFKT
jgi:hypothetical protein